MNFVFIVRKKKITYPPGMLSLVTLLHSLSFSLLHFPLPVRAAVTAVVFDPAFGVAILNRITNKIKFKQQTHDTKRNN